MKAFISINPKANMKDDAEYWNKYYTENPGAFGGRRIRPQNEEILKHKNKGKLLDLGCGEGTDALFFAEKGFNVTGVDVSKIVIKRFLKEAESRKFKVKGVFSQILDYKIKGKYDVIMCNYVLHFIKKEFGLKIIKNIQNHTRKNGINVLSGFRNLHPFFNKKTKKYFWIKHNQLHNLYRGWKILLYLEGLSRTREKDKKGNQIKQETAIIVTQKK